MHLDGRQVYFRSHIHVDFSSVQPHAPGSLAPLTCEPPPGWVGSHVLHETQMQRIPVGDGTEAGHARKSTKSAQIT